MARVRRIHSAAAVLLPATIAGISAVKSQLGSHALIGRLLGLPSKTRSAVGFFLGPGLISQRYTKFAILRIQENDPRPAGLPHERSKVFCPNAGESISNFGAHDLGEH
jgi:hypothetical protein